MIAVELVIKGGQHANSHEYPPKLLIITSINDYYIKHFSFFPQASVP